MDMQNMELMSGSLQISTDVIAKIARCAAMEFDGVADVACGRQQSKKAKELLEMVNLQPPVTVEMREGTADITLNLIVRFGTCVPVMAEKVQKNVKSAVQNMTRVTVSRVNLIVAGLASEAPAAAAE